MPFARPPSQATALEKQSLKGSFCLELQGLICWTEPAVTKLGRALES